MSDSEMTTLGKREREELEHPSNGSIEPKVQPDTVPEDDDDDDDIGPMPMPESAGGNGQVARKKRRGESSIPSIQQP